LVAPVKNLPLPCGAAFSKNSLTTCYYYSRSQLGATHILKTIFDKF